MSDLHTLGVAELAAAIASKQTSSVEAAQHLLARAKQHASLGAYLAFNEDATLAQARAADARIADNAGARDICIATGVPAGNVGNASIVQLNAQIPALFGGNPNLGEETGTSWTVGAVFQPSFVPGLTITADYFNIEVDDFITVAGGSLQGLINLCYSGNDINSVLCDPFRGIRNADGAIDVDAPPLVGGINAA